MTSTHPAPGNYYNPTFPEHPADGFEVVEEVDDGRLLIWTYNKTLNQWGARFVYPESSATQGWVLGQGYVQKSWVKAQVEALETRIKELETRLSQ